MIALKLVMFSALFATLDAAKLKNPELTESLLQESDTTSAGAPMAEFDGTAVTATLGDSVTTTSDSWRGAGGDQSYVQFNEIDLSLQTAWTIAVWAKMDEIDDRGALGIFAIGSYSPMCGFMCQVLQNGNLHCRHTGGQGRLDASNIFPNLQADTWFHFAAVLDGNNLSVYYNGNFVWSKTHGYTAGYTCDSKLTLGGWPGETTDTKFLLGEIKSPHVLRTAATAADVVNLMNTELSSASSGGATGDPHFHGFDGSRYDFQGEPGAVFNIISDETFQLNARFVASPTDGKTYMGVIGVRVGSNEIIVTPDVTVLNDATITTGQHVQLTSIEGEALGLVICTEKRVRVKTSGFQIDITTSDTEGFSYLDLDSAAHSEKLVSPHGVLGQTAQYMVDGTVAHPVHLSHKNRDAQGFLDGNVFDYVVADGLLGTEFTFNRFGKQAVVSREPRRRHFAFARALYKDDA